METHEFGGFRSLRVHMFVCPKLFPNKVRRTWSLSSECKLDQADFTDWISFLRSNPWVGNQTLFWGSHLKPSINLEKLKRQWFRYESLMTMNCFGGMVDRQKAFSLIFSRDHYFQKFSPSRISDTPRAGFKPTKNLTSSFVE